MLRVLIVDDDALTRKGIQTLMPWEKHDMVVIGEAANGKAALEFLKTNDVDLVLVDMDMPVMNGIHFIEAAKQLYPELCFVVLTVHTEFEYIQNALRHGAIDYIAKPHIDKENFNTILERIQNSIAKQKAISSGTPDLNWKQSRILQSSILALVSADAEHNGHVLEFLEINRHSMGQGVHELLPGVLVFPDEQRHFAFPQVFPNTMLLRISDVDGMSYHQLASLLRKYRDEQFFYDYEPQPGINDKRMFELQEVPSEAKAQIKETVKQNWLSLGWALDCESFEAYVASLRGARLKKKELIQLLIAIESVWNKSYSKLAGQRIELPAAISSWIEVEDWLSQLFEKTSDIRMSIRYSPTVTSSVLAAKQYADAYYASPISTAEIAKRANMSYGYFSRCFHDVVGITFSDYCIQLRMEKAKEYLASTHHTIQSIALDVGYSDEKYFSRIFRKVAGCSPSHYRKSNFRK